MKKILLALTLLITACAPSLNDEISEFLKTKSEEPLQGTVWEYVTGGEYNKYIYFNDGEANFFWGQYNNGEIERWSDFYSASYELKDGKIWTDIYYPEYGKSENLYQISVIKSEGAFKISSGEEEYHYIQCNLADLECQWIIITVNITPWSDF